MQKVQIDLQLLIALVAVAQHGLDVAAADDASKQALQGKLDGANTTIDGLQAQLADLQAQKDDPIPDGLKAQIDTLTQSASQVAAAGTGTGGIPPATDPTNGQGTQSAS